MTECALDFSAYFFYTECLIKILALGFDGYWADAWSRFDFILVLGALADQFATELVRSLLPVPPMLLRVLRVLRVLSILRLLKGAMTEALREQRGARLALTLQTAVCRR